jgi:hypothetical protein
MCNQDGGGSPILLPPEVPLASVRHLHELLLTGELKKAVQMMCGRFHRGGLIQGVPVLLYASV